MTKPTPVNRENLKELLNFLEEMLNKMRPDLKGSEAAKEAVVEIAKMLLKMEKQDIKDLKNDKNQMLLQLAFDAQLKNKPNLAKEALALVLIPVEELQKNPKLGGEFKQKTLDIANELKVNPVLNLEVHKTVDNVLNPQYKSDAQKDDEELARTDDAIDKRSEIEAQNKSNLAKGRIKAMHGEASVDGGEVKAEGLDDEMGIGAGENENSSFLEEVKENSDSAHSAKTPFKKKLTPFD
jgi:hypothetical protein